MMKRPTKQRINGLLSLLLFAVFAVCVLTVLMTGAGVYQRLADRDDSSYTQRTAGQYISTKIRQADSPDDICVDSFDGQPALTLRQDLGGVIFLTQIYCYDGYLRELFHLEDSGLSPQDGEMILPMEELSAELENNLLLIRMTDADGQSQQLVLSLRNGEEASHEE